jgi:hypothetical protein
MLFVLAAVVSAAAVTSAQSQYNFTRIADTVQDDPGLAGPLCVVLGNDGTVLVLFIPTGASANGFAQVWGKRDGESFTQMAPRVGSCPAINDHGVTAYIAIDPSTSEVSLVRNENGVLTPLASSTTVPELGNSPYTTLSNNGNVAYKTLSGGIYVKPAGFWVYEPGNPPLNFVFDPVNMNDTDTVAFLALRPDSSAPTGQRTGVYRGSGVPLIEDGASVAGASLTLQLERPVVNNSGTVAFLGHTGGPFGPPTVYTTTDGLSVATVGTNPFPGPVGINDSGTVAFRRGNGVYIGRPGAPDQKVIDTGDPLDGSTFGGTLLWYESINSSGQIAFFAQLADGRSGVYRADPCAVNVSSLITVSQGNAKLNRRTGRYTQTVTLRNNDGPITVPVSLVLDNLPQGVALVNPYGTTSCSTPGGSPYVDVDLGADSTFSRRERISVTLEFDNVSAQPITYTTRVLAGVGSR